MRGLGGRLAVGRRGVLGGSAALAALRAGGVAAAARAPMRQELAVGMASSRMDVITVAERTTFMLAIELESQATELRVGVANMAATPYAVEGVCCCETTAERPWTPNWDGAWRYLGFGGARRVEVPADPAAVPGPTNPPAILWSDWLPYRTGGRGRPVMLFRALVPPRTLAVADVDWPSDPRQLLPDLPPRLRAARQDAGDLVTDPERPMSRPTGVGRSPIFVVQYRSAVQGIQMVVGGDSQLAQWHTFAQQAAIRLSTPSRPVAVWNTAWAGAPSRTFWPILQTAIAQARPSVALIQGWTANDGFGVPIYDRYVRQVQQSVRDVRRGGGIPIVCTSMPRKLFGTDALADWQRFNGQLGRIAPEAMIFDLTPLVEDPARPGDWDRAFSDDGAHPSLRGSTRMTAAFTRFLAPLL